MPRSCRRSSTLRSESGNRTYNITVRRMISGLVLKYLNGECFVIRRGYETTLPVSSSFCLTVPLRVFFIPKRHRPTLFALTKLKWKTNTKRHSQADDLWAGFKVAEWGVFCHSEMLRDHPARLKLVLFDSAYLFII